MWSDLRFAVRQVRVRPAFHALLILTFALGIGLNTALFTVVNALLLRAIPGFETDRLVVLGERYGPLDRDHEVMGDVVHAWRAQAKSFEQIEAGAFETFNLSGAGLPEVVSAADITAGFFHLYRAQALLGRTFLPGEDSPGRNLVAILDHNFWTRRFGGDPNLVGRTLRLDRRGYLVVGIMPPGFHPLGASAVSVYLPLVMEEKSAWDFWTLARLRPGVPLGRAQAEMTALSRAMAAADPSRKGSEAHVVPLQEVAQRDLRAGLLALFAAVALVLLIACANTANLLLARASFRAREFALRLTLGADRWRLARQLITEGLLATASGGLAGAILGGWSLRLLIRWNPAVLPRLDEVRVDGWVIAFGVGITLLSAGIATMGPVLAVMRHDLNPVLQSGSRGSQGTRQSRARYALVISEIALTFVLVAASMLVLQSFARLERVDLGYNPRKLLSLDLSSPVSPTSDGADVLALYRQIVARLEGLPGVSAVALTTHPPVGGIGITFPVLVAGRPAPPLETPEAHTSIVSPGYFRAMGIPVRRGRGFTIEDRRGSAPVAVINESMARRFFGTADAIGAKLLIKTIDPNAGHLGKLTAREIVGVLGDVKEENLREQPPFQIYLPLEQNPVVFISVVMRTAGDPAALALPAQREIAKEDKDLPASGVKAMEVKIDELLGAPRRATALFAGFALLALMLAVVGVYGVLSYTVSTRTQEIGIRMALGSGPAGILRLVLGESLRHAAWGVAIGWGVVFAGEHWFSSELFGIRATDPLTLVAVSIGMLLVSLGAALVPARSAAGVDPMTALRAE